MAVPINTLADKSQPCIGFLSAFPIDSLIGDKCALFAGYSVSESTPRHAVGWCLLELLANRLVCSVLCPQDIQQHLDATLSALARKVVYYVKKEKRWRECCRLHSAGVRDHHVKLARCTHERLLYSCRCRTAIAAWCSGVSLP